MIPKRHVSSTLTAENLNLNKPHEQLIQIIKIFFSWLLHFSFTSQSGMEVFMITQSL